MTRLDIASRLRTLLWGDRTSARRSRPIRPRGSRMEPLEPRIVCASVQLAPLAADDAFSVGEDQVLAGNVIAGGSAGGGDVSTSGLPSRVVEINSQSVTGGAALTLASGATLSMSASGGFSYEAATSPELSAIPAGEAGSDGFEYTLAPAFSGLVVLGDSLSDQGRLFGATGGLFPPDPPYFQGRISNGPVWIEHLAPRLGLSVSAANNLAVAGATTGTANYNEPLLGTDLPGLADELTGFVTSLGGQPADPDALYVVWAGANDFFVPFDDAAAAIGQAVTNLATTVGTLQAVGAEHILLMNMPDLGLTPFALASGQAAQLTALSTAFNTALDATLAGLALDVTLVDAFDRFQEIVADPGAVGLTNVTHAAFDGTTVIGDPEQFLFWDAVHPTAAGHRLIAEAVFEILTDEASVSIDISDATTTPRVSVENRPGALPGQIELLLSADDHSPADLAGNFRYQVDWGDGDRLETISGPATGITATHTFASAGVRRIAIQALDQDGDASPIFREAVAWGTAGADQLHYLPHGHDRVRVRLNGVTHAVIEPASIDRLVAFTLGGHDFVTAAALRVPLELDGGAGHDVIFGGQGDDLLRGGKGNDAVFGLAGDDELWGGGGRDVLFGGPGSDLVWGGDDDLVFGHSRRRRSAMQPQRSLLIRPS